MNNKYDCIDMKIREDMIWARSLLVLSSDVTELCKHELGLDSFELDIFRKVAREIVLENKIADTLFYSATNVELQFYNEIKKYVKESDVKNFIEWMRISFLLEWTGSKWYAEIKDAMDEFTKEIDNGNYIKSADLKLNKHRHFRIMVTNYINEHFVLFGELDSLDPISAWDVNISENYERDEAPDYVSGILSDIEMFRCFFKHIVIINDYLDNEVPELRDVFFKCFGVNINIPSIVKDILKKPILPPRIVGMLS